MAVYVSGDSEEIARRLLAPDISAPGAMVWAAIGCMTRTSVVCINDNLNTDRYIFVILRSVVVPYFRGLPNVIVSTLIILAHILHFVL